MNVRTLKPASPDVIRIVQITDTHIFADPDARFDGVDTFASLRAVLAAVKALRPAPDLVLATGDLTDDPEPGAYARLLPELQALGLPVFCLPGNHDDPKLLYKMLDAGNVRTDRVLGMDDWRIILLNDYVPGSDGGRLSDSDLVFLQNDLSNAEARHVLIAVHHPPVSIRSGWMDAMMLENGADLLGVAGHFPHVRAIVFGHIHQAFDEMHAGVRLLGAPSTCVQFRPGADEYSVDALAPGYRRLQLMRDGRIDTGVVRVEPASGEAPRARLSLSRGRRGGNQQD